MDNLDGNLEEDIEEPEDEIDKNNIDFALTVQAITIVNQETLDSLLGFWRVTRSDEVRQPGLSYEDQIVQAKRKKTVKMAVKRKKRS